MLVLLYCVTLGCMLECVSIVSDHYVVLMFYCGGVLLCYAFYCGIVVVGFQFAVVCYVCCCLCVVFHVLYCVVVCCCVVLSCYAAYLI